MTNPMRPFIFFLVGSAVPLLLLHGQVTSPHTGDLKHIEVVLVGDSTVAIQGGWGPGFCSHLLPQAHLHRPRRKRSIHKKFP